MLFAKAGGGGGRRRESGECSSSTSCRSHTHSSGGRSTCEMKGGEFNPSISLVWNLCRGELGGWRPLTSDLYVLLLPQLCTTSMLQSRRSELIPRIERAASNALPLSLLPQTSLRFRKLKSATFSTRIRRWKKTLFCCDAKKKTWRLPSSSLFFHCAALT